MTPKPKMDKQLAAIIRAQPWVITLLGAVRDEQLPDAWIGAGLLRDLVWGERFGSGFNPDGVRDVDVAFFDPTRPDRAYDDEVAHQLVPFHPTGNLAGFGWDTEPDRARRLRILATAYDPGLRPDLLVDYAAIRLLGMAAHIESQIRAANPAFTVHHDRHFAVGYRAAAAFVLTNRDRLLG